jgi:hypothetical protein
MSSKTTTTALSDTEIELLKVALEAAAARWNEWDASWTGTPASGIWRQQAAEAQALAVKLAGADSVDLYFNLPSSLDEIFAESEA